LGINPSQPSKIICWKSSHCILLTCAHLLI
jgi:hypothetical protein